MRWFRRWFGAAFAAVLGASQAWADGTRVDVPIRQVALPNGTIRYTIPVTIGDSAPIEAQFDTGSFGLRVLAAAVKGAGYETTPVERAYPFGSGVMLHGPLAHATLGVGDAKSAQPLTFQLVESVGCGPRKPKCPASRLSQDEYRIGGDGLKGQGFSAIIGTSLRAPPAAEAARNPLAALSPGGWIVTLPRPGSGAPGHLVLNPTPDEVAGFALVHLTAQPPQNAADGISGWMDAALPGCLKPEGSGEKVCGRTLLDSGAPGFVAYRSSVEAPKRWGSGSRMILEIAGGGVDLDWPFVTGTDDSTSMIEAPARGESGDRISAGTYPFFSYSVFYDARNGTMGFKARGQDE